MDSTIVKVHPDGTGARKENGPQAIGKSRGGWTTKVHLIAADARTAVTFPLSPGQAHDAPGGRRLLHRPGGRQRKPPLLMDRAYEGNETRQLALDWGLSPWFPHAETGLILGNMTGKCTNSAMRLNDCSGD